MRRILFTSLCVLYTTLLFSQVNFCPPSYPQIGKIIPNFLMDSVDHYSQENISPQDIKGKWTVLDFWGEYCGGCVASFPALKVMQTNLKDSVQFILCAVTYKDPRTAKAMYEKINGKLKLDLPISYDQNTVKDWQISGLPTIIVIDPNNTVRAITTHITENDIRTFIQGGEPALERNYLLSESPGKAYDWSLPFLVNNNGGSELGYEYRTVFFKWQNEMPTNNVTRLLL